MWVLQHFASCACMLVIPATVGHTHTPVRGRTQVLERSRGYPCAVQNRRCGRTPRHGISRTRRRAAETGVALLADAFEYPLRAVHDACCRDALCVVRDEGARGEAARVVCAVGAALGGSTAQAAKVARPGWARPLRLYGDVRSGWVPDPRSARVARFLSPPQAPKNLGDFAVF